MCSVYTYLSMHVCAYMYVTTAFDFAVAALKLAIKTRIIRTPLSCRQKQCLLFRVRAARADIDQVLIREYLQE